MVDERKLTTTSGVAARKCTRKNGNVTPIRARNSISVHFEEQIRKNIKREMYYKLAFSSDDIPKTKKRQKAARTKKKDVDEKIKGNQASLQPNPNALKRTSESSSSIHDGEIIEQEEEVDLRVELEHIDTGAYELSRTKSKIGTRVRESNRRVKRAFWGHHLENIVEQEQFKQMYENPRKILQITDSNSPRKDEARRKLRGREKIFYGARISLYHDYSGKYLSINNNQNIARIGQKEARFTIINLDDPHSTAPISYGDRVGFAVAGNKRALGTKIVRSQNGLRVCSVDIDVRSVLTAKWRIIDPENVLGSFSSNVESRSLAHLDCIGLEQDDNFLGVHGETAILNPESSKGDLESSSLWIVRLHANASIKKVPSAHQVLTKAQSQIRHIRDHEKQQKLFGKVIRKEMIGITKRLDDQYLLFDPTSTKTHGPQGVKEYLETRLVETSQQTQINRLNKSSKKNRSSSPKGGGKHSPQDNNHLSSFINFWNSGIQSVSPRAASHLGKTRLDEAKLRALTHRLEMQVPSLVWDQIREQTGIEEERHHDERDAAARSIQKMFRRWKRERWGRIFRTTDNDCEEQAKKFVEQKREEESKAKLIQPKQKPYMESLSSSRALQCLERVQTYSSVGVRLRSPSYKQLQRAMTESTEKSHNSSRQQIENFFAITQKSTQLQETIELNMESNCESEGDESDDNIDAHFDIEMDDSKRSIESHLRVLRRVNPILYGSMLGKPLPNLACHTKSPKGLLSRPRSAAYVITTANLSNLRSKPKLRRPISAIAFPGSHA